MKLFQQFQSELARQVRRAGDAGFTGVALDGGGVESAIAQEIKIKPLEKALAVARQHHEGVWIGRCLRRLHEVRGTPEDALALAHHLAAQGDLAESQHLLSGPAADLKGSQRGRDVHANLAAKQGHIAQAMELLGLSSKLSDQTFPRGEVLSLASETLAQAPIKDALALITQLSGIYPNALSLRGLLIRGHLYEGDYQRADELASISREDLTGAHPADRRSLREAIAETYAHRGWMNEVFEFCRLVLQEDPAHWSLFAQAGAAAQFLAREAEFDQLLKMIPEDVRRSPAASSELARWHIMNHRSEQAEEIIAPLRKRSAVRYLSARLHMSLNRQDPAGIRQAYEDCLRCGLPAFGPTLSYCLYTYHHDATAKSLQAGLDLLEPYHVTARHNVGYWQLVLRCETALENVENVRTLYSGLPQGLKRAAKLAPFEMYLEALDGHHQQAQGKWVRCLRQTRHSCVNARSSYPATLKLRYEETDGAVLAFSMVYNGAPYLDWYLDHYRSLGVDHFFIVDNSSDDGTCEHLLAQPDVSVFSCSGSFSEAAFGVIWINHLLQRFGIGHWCLYVDIDEGFVFPGQDRGKTLKDLLKYCDTYGFGALHSAAIDMYPAEFSGERGLTSISQCTQFDADYTSIRSEMPPYFLTQGGIRQRMTGLALSVNKAPLVRMEPHVYYINGNHNTTHLPVADVTAALLHYKFVGDVKKEIQKTVARGAHFAGAVSYRQLQASLDELGWHQSLVSDHSRLFEGATSLEHQGLMKTSESWEHF